MLAGNRLLPQGHQRGGAIQLGQIRQLLLLLVKTGPSGVDGTPHGAHLLPDVLVLAEQGRPHPRLPGCKLRWGHGLELVGESVEEGLNSLLHLLRRRLRSLHHHAKLHNRKVSNDPAAHDVPELLLGPQSVVDRGPHHHAQQHQVHAVLDGGDAELVGGDDGVVGVSLDWVAHSNHCLAGGLGHGGLQGVLLGERLGLEHGQQILGNGHGLVLGHISVEESGDPQALHHVRHVRLKAGQGEGSGVQLCEDLIGAVSADFGGHLQHIHRVLERHLAGLVRQLINQRLLHKVESSIVVLTCGEPRRHLLHQLAQEVRVPVELQLIPVVERPGSIGQSALLQVLQLLLHSRLKQVHVHHRVRGIPRGSAVLRGLQLHPDGRLGHLPEAAQSLPPDLDALQVRGQDHWVLTSRRGGREAVLRHVLQGRGRLVVPAIQAGPIVDPLGRNLLLVELHIVPLVKQAATVESLGGQGHLHVCGSHTSQQLRHQRAVGLLHQGVSRDDVTGLEGRHAISKRGHGVHHRVLRFPEVKIHGSVSLERLVEIHVHIRLLHGIDVPEEFRSHSILILGALGCQGEDHKQQSPCRCVIDLEVDVGGQVLLLQGALQAVCPVVAQHVGQIGLGLRSVGLAHGGQGEHHPELRCRASPHADELTHITGVKGRHGSVVLLRHTGPLLHVAEMALSHSQLLGHVQLGEDNQMHPV
mmetsp:Transcript_8220/g.17984  ORF Transcript_8220/g.17984 Transcript_8220/m.17984 type:complete len:697 (+) Transcript_8220:234-2324(+)